MMIEVMRAEEYQNIPLHSSTKRLDRPMEEDQRSRRGIRCDSSYYNNPL